MSILADWPWLKKLQQDSRLYAIHCASAGLSQLCVKFKYCCFYCGRKVELKSWYFVGDVAATRDHFIPRSKGGGEGDNIVLACLECNSIKGDRMPDDLWERCKGGYL